MPTKKAMFRDQVVTLSTWFDRWSICEQTVAMVALFKRLHPIQTKFLTTVLHRQLNDYNNELKRIEILANDTNFMTSISNPEIEAPTIRDLILYLPLLNPKNIEVRNLYIIFIPKALKYSIEHLNQMEEARELLSYSLIHPAFGSEDRYLFASWLHQCEEIIATTPMKDICPQLGNSPPIIDFNWQQVSNSSNNCQQQQQQQQRQQQHVTAGLIPNYSTPSVAAAAAAATATANFHRIRRSNSLTPPVLHSEHWSAQEEICSSKPRSLSLSSEISPQSGSLASSGSESHLDDTRPSFLNPGMRDVPSWLKSLRLHKYSSIFAYLTYDEMMNLTETKLEAEGITRGARNKIILSICKLKERSTHLKKVYEEMNLEQNDSIRLALNEIKWALTTPMLPIEIKQQQKCENIIECCSGMVGGGIEIIGTSVTSGGQQQRLEPIGTNRGEFRMRSDDADLSGWILKTIGKACELNPDMDCESLLVSVIEKCLQHDGFNVKQKRLLSLWRQQHVPNLRRNSNSSHSTTSIYHHHHHHQQHIHQRNTTISPSNTTVGHSNSSRQFSPRVLNINQLGGFGSSSWSPSSSIQAIFMAKRPSLQDSLLEPVNWFPSDVDTSDHLIKNHQEYITQQQQQQQHQQNIPTTLDITARLESLCLSMTEAALGPAFNTIG